jgi:hypothetical protein
MNKGWDNLIPLNKRTPEEVKAISTKGAIASNKAQAKRKTFREIFELLLNDKAIDGSNITNNELLALQMIVEAHKGNTKAFELVRDTIGEKPTDKSEVKTEITISPEEKKMLNTIYSRINE